VAAVTDESNLWVFCVFRIAGIEDAKFGAVLARTEADARLGIIEGLGWIPYKLHVTRLKRKLVVTAYEQLEFASDAP
jgi:hypothetical protein